MTAACGKEHHKAPSQGGVKLNLLQLLADRRPGKVGRLN
jgi:hypothetical protein